MFHIYTTGQAADLSVALVNHRLSGVTFVDYIADVLRTILDDHPVTRIEDLTPWYYEQPSSLAA